MSGVQSPGADAGVKRCAADDMVHRKNRVGDMHCRGAMTRARPHALSCILGSSTDHSVSAHFRFILASAYHSVEASRLHVCVVPNNRVDMSRNPKNAHDLLRRPAHARRGTDTRHGPEPLNVRVTVWVADARDLESPGGS